MSCIIHQIWLSEDKSLTSECPPTSFQTTMNRWKSSHPRSQYILWTDISVETLLRNEFGENILAFYESLRFLIEKVNFAKYCILYHYGGIYADGNIECVADHETIFRALPENALFFVENPNSRCLQVTVCYLISNYMQMYLPNQKQLPSISLYIENVGILFYRVLARNQLPRWLSRSREQSVYSQSFLSFPSECLVSHAESKPIS